MGSLHCLYGSIADVAPINEGRRSMAADSFTKDRMAWLERVQGDRGLTPSAFSIAFAIARHLNRRTGQAFPSRDALAAMTGLRPRQVTDLVHSLRDRGFLALRRRRNQSTVYTLIMGPDVQPAALPEVEQSAVPEDQDVQSSAPRTCNPSHIGMCTPPQPNPLNEPSEEEPFDVEGAREGLFGGSLEAVKADGRGDAIETDFAEWWAVYPLHKGRKHALKAYVAVRKKGAEHAELLRGAQSYAGERAGKDPTFTKYGATWLNGEHWTDEPTPAVAWTDRRQSFSDIASEALELYE